MSVTCLQNVCDICLRHLSATSAIFVCDISAIFVCNICFLYYFQQVLSFNIGDTELDLGHSFDSISLKLDRTAVSMENWSRIVFGPIRPNEGEGLGVMQSREFLEKENLTTNLAEIQ